MLRKGDIVKVKRGKFKNKTGKINDANLKKLKVSIEGLQTQKKDGTKVQIYFYPSKLQIQELNLEDKRRLKNLQKGIKEEKLKPSEERNKNAEQKAKEKENVSKKK